MNIGLFEDGGAERLLPLTWLRACFELRCGRDRLIDKVQVEIGQRPAAIWIRPALEAVVRARTELVQPRGGEDWCLINARALVNGPVALPQPGVAWQVEGELVAVGVRADQLEGLTIDFFRDEARLAEWLSGWRVERPPEHVALMRYPWNLVGANEAELRRQCRRGGVRQGTIYPGVHFLQPASIHVAPGATVKPGVVLDAESGPIHIAEDARIEPNAVIQGPCYIGPGSLVRPGAALRGGTTIGPVCKVAGEIEASIFHGFANKQHDGYLGHSYVCPWVNLGAGTVTSDLKNTYGAIRVYVNGVGVESGQRFVGSMFGDHCKTGIGTILPTGCILGVATNVFTRRPLPRFVPSFGWLTDEGLTEYRTDKAIQIAQIVMGRRDVELSDEERALLMHVAQEARQVEAAGWS